jgi:benzoate/toluate 1,2-dioxygenase alpha subunit
MGNQKKIDFSKYLIDDEEKGIYRCDRKMFTDPDIFEMEMKSGSTCVMKVR